MIRLECWRSRDMMTITEAKRRLQDLWKYTVERIMSCEMHVDDSLTEEYPWGWVFYFVPKCPDQCPHPYKRRAYAYDLETGDSIPVGTKGLEQALRHLGHRGTQSEGMGDASPADS
jgi:hypothetical protein